MDSNHHVPARGYRTNSDLYEMPSERTNRKYTSWTQISNSVGEKVRKVKGKSPSIEPGPQEDYRPQSKQDNPVELEAQDPVHTYSRSFGPLPDPSFRQNSLQHSGMERGDLPAYVYHPATKGLVKRVSSPHMVPYRDQNSFGSTKAQADMPWERNHGRSGGGSPTFGLQRRPVAGLQHSEEKEAIALHKSEDQENSYEEPVQFTRVKLAIANAQLQFPELKGSGGETTEATIQRFIKEYTRQSSQLKDTSSRPRRSSRSRSKIRKLETENHELLNEVRGVKSKLHDRELDYRALIKKHNEEMEKLNEQVTSLKKDKKDAEASYSKHKRILADENDRLKSFNEANLRSLKADVKNLKSLNENQDKDIIQLNKSYIREAELRINFERKAGNLVQELGMAQSDKDRAIHENDVRWQGELNAQKSSYDNVIHSLKTEARQLQNARDKEREERKKELRQQEKELEERFEQESKGYQTVIEQFRTDVLKRDHFKARYLLVFQLRFVTNSSQGYTDSEMSSLFKKLANGIEDFRLDWDSRKQSEWPYTEVQLHELHPKNTRKLKQHIIQNTLWLLLWEHIFRSPFRIFGSLGREQDLHWNDIYAAGTLHVVQTTR